MKFSFSPVIGRKCTMRSCDSDFWYSQKWIVVLVTFVFVYSCVIKEALAANVGQPDISEPAFRENVRTNRHVSYFEEDLCTANHEVTEGAIIRVHDSQKLGAKYLNETDLGQGLNSRTDCFRLCCRTPRCNVYVFEEKNSGSCYLFDCGPPEDFRCKFTPESQYTVGYLRKRVFPFPLNQHETELSQLRSIEGVAGIQPSYGGNDGSNFVSITSATNQNSPSQKQQETGINLVQPQHSQIPEIEAKTVTSTSAATTTTVPPNQHPVHNNPPLQQQPIQQPLVDNANIQHLQQAHQQSLQQQQQQPQQQQTQAQQQQLKPQEPQPLQQRRSSCTRNQFECKSSGECIAIYNACDGIPQCSDGSDEAVELHCPSDNSNFGYNSPPRIPSGAADPNSGKINPMSVGSSSSGSVPVLPAGQIPNGGNAIPGRLSQQEDYRFSLPSSQQSAASISAGGATQRLATGSGKMDVTFPLQPQSSQGGSQSMNIFNHKDGGIMDETYANQNQPQRHTPYWKQPNPLDYSTVDLPQQNTGGSFSPQSIQLPGPFTYGTVSNAGNYGNTYNLPGYGYQQLQPQGMPPGQQMQQTPLQFNQYGGSNNAHAGGYPPLQQPQQPFYQQAQYTPNMSPGDGMMYRPPNSASGMSPVGNSLPTSSTAIKANAGPVSVNATASIGEKSAQSSGTSGTSSPVTQLGVSYREISKLQLPENLRSLSAELQSFAAESENDIEMHAAGAGAILAFILGLMMSVVMALIVGCRLRRIGTRRRGKNRLDPDYLVDGMYL